MFLILFYILCVLFLAYSAFDLIYFFGSLFLSKGKAAIPVSKNPICKDDLTIQVPVFNTGENIYPLLRSINGLEVKFPIQILDSSSDGTDLLISKHFGGAEVKDYGTFTSQKWENIELIHFKEKKGFKAWALQEGIKRITTPFVAVFDADDVIESQFFEQTLPIIESDNKIGFVQASWRAANAEENFMARLDAISIETEHKIEDRFRNHFRIPFTIHGSAFVARTELVQRLQWRDRFLSEDIDLALHMNFSGYYGVYVSEQEGLGRACTNINQFFRQKRRWIEGRSQMLSVHLPQLLLSAEISRARKIFLLHYLAYFLRFPIFIALAALGLILGGKYLVYTLAILFVQIFTKQLMNLKSATMKADRSVVAAFLEPFLFWVFVLPYSYRSIRGLTLRASQW